MANSPAEKSQGRTARARPCRKTQSRFDAAASAHPELPPRRMHGPVLPPQPRPRKHACLRRNQHAPTIANRPESASHPSCRNRPEGGQAMRRRSPSRPLGSRGRKALMSGFYKYLPAATPFSTPKHSSPMRMQPYLRPQPEPDRSAFFQGPNRPMSRPAKALCPAACMSPRASACIPPAPQQGIRRNAGKFFPPFRD